jgi:hypothetical protein
LLRRRGARDQSYFFFAFFFVFRLAAFFFAAMHPSIKERGAYRKLSPRESRDAAYA